jgi:hypothetical protein
VTIFLAAIASAYVCQAAESRPVDTTVRISSTPAGAFVLVSSGETFREDAALALGKTPLMRRMRLAANGSPVRITKAGYQVWEGKLSPGASDIKAELVPLTDAQKQELGWFGSPPCRRLTVVPVRLGIQKLGSKADGFETTSDAVSLTNRFLTAFEAMLKQRFGSRAELATPTNLVTDAFWRQLANQMKGINVATVGFTPTPRRPSFTTGENASLAALDGAVLLVRAEAHYLGKGVIFARAAVPLLLSAGSAAGGYPAAQSTGASFYTYSIYGGLPSSEDILVQRFLLNSSTRELMWYGRRSCPSFSNTNKSPRTPPFARPKKCRQRSWKSNDDFDK